MEHRTRKKISFLSLIIGVVYIIIILYFMLFSDRLGRVDGYSEYRYNLVLFNEIRRFVMYRHYVSTGAFVLNIIGNILVFSPIGFLLPIWNLKKSGAIRIIIYSFLFSLLIETTQLVLQVGVFDVDDLFMNTLGGLLGYLCYCIVRQIYRKIKRSEKS